MPTNSRSGEWRIFFKKHTSCDAHHTVSIRERRRLEGPGGACPTGHAQLEATTTARNHQFATALNLGRSVKPPPLGPGAVVVKNHACPTPRPSRGHAASPRSPPRACAQPPRARTARWPGRVWVGLRVTHPAALAPQSLEDAAEPPPRHAARRILNLRAPLLDIAAASAQLKPPRPVARCCRSLCALRVDVAAASTPCRSTPMQPPRCAPCRRRRLHTVLPPLWSAALHHAHGRRCDLNRDRVSLGRDRGG